MSNRPKETPALLVIRRALQSWAQDIPEEYMPPRVLVALSGGPDSVALLLGVASLGWDVEAVVVDHGLQANSALVSQNAVAVAQIYGIPAHSVKVNVSTDASGNSGGLEAAARDARYVALGDYAQKTQRVVLTGHTQSDAVENFFLALVRGSGTASLAGMEAFTPEHYVARAPVGRPLLGVSRDETEQACDSEEVSVWVDPHNRNPRFLRSHIRMDLIPVVTDILGSSIAENIARTTQLLRQDQDYLLSEAQQKYKQLIQGDDEYFFVRDLTGVHPAIRKRMLKIWLEPLGEIYSSHLEAVERTILSRRGEVAVPGGRPGGRNIVRIVGGKLFLHCG